MESIVEAVREVKGFEVDELLEGFPVKRVQTGMRGFQTAR